jgi:protein TonB
MFDNLRNMLNFDDLLFEKRNREYGAYQLRKRYNSVVVGSILAAITIFSSVIIIPFSIKPKNEKVITAGNNYVPVQMEHFTPPDEQLYVPPAATPPPVRIQEIVKYIPPVVVDSIVPPGSDLPTSDQLETLPVNDEIASTGSGSGGDMVGDGGEAANNPFFIVEIMPSFKGGDINRFRDWVIKRTNYPQQAIDKKIKGKVQLTFIVETDGAVSNVTVVKGVDPIIDVEAVKAIEASPKWTPGLQRGQPVRMRYAIALDFVL